MRLTFLLVAAIATSGCASTAGPTESCAVKPTHEFIRDVAGWPMATMARTLPIIGQGLELVDKGRQKLKDRSCAGRATSASNQLRADQWQLCVNSPCSYASQCRETFGERFLLPSCEVAGRPAPVVAQQPHTVIVLEADEHALRREIIRCMGKDPEERDDCVTHAINHIE